MSAYGKGSRCRRHFAATGIALVFPLAVLAADPVPPEAVSVQVFPDRYVAAGKPFADIAALEAWAKPLPSRALWLDSCGPASTGPLLKAVERLHAVYADGVRIRTYAAREPACLQADQQASHDSLNFAQPYLPYYPSDRSGRSLVP